MQLNSAITKRNKAKTIDFIRKIIKITHWVLLWIFSWSAKKTTYWWRERVSISNQIWRKFIFSSIFILRESVDQHNGSCAPKFYICVSKDSIYDRRSMRPLWPKKYKYGSGTRKPLYISSRKPRGLASSCPGRGSRKWNMLVA